MDEVDTAFPMIAYTERPDRFCAGLVEGRVGVIVDGIPLGYLLPGTVGQFFKTGQDRSQNWVAASFLSILRYLCMLGSLFLPAFYVASVNFHPEMIPARLAWSISEAKTDVPFSTVFEVLIMLLAFEAVQEAGLRLPGPIGQTASILGGLVVGSAAVEASIVSPVVLIVVAIAGHCRVHGAQPGVFRGAADLAVWPGHRRQHRRAVCGDRLGGGAGVPAGPAGKLWGALSHPLRRLRQRAGEGPRRHPLAHPPGEVPGECLKDPKPKEAGMKRVLALVFLLLLASDRLCRHPPKSGERRHGGGQCSGGGAGRPGHSPFGGCGGPGEEEPFLL